jgi:hypothetical protein
VGGVQGRINPIRLGQVGIRCRHCGSLTNKAQASGGGVYYSRTIRGLYHLAQLMAKGHLENCKMVDAPTRAKLAKLCQSSKRSANGTQEFWFKRWQAMGVYEKKGCLWSKH